MEGHGIRMMTEVFGGMMKVIDGCLVLQLQKEVQKDMPDCIMMKDVFQKYLTKNGKLLLMDLIGMMLDITMSKSDVAINQKVNRH